MIFIMTEKVWSKYKKKLVQPKDYLVVDGTDEEWEGSSKFTNVQRIDSFNPPGALVKAYADDDGTFSASKVEKLENRFYGGSPFMSAVCALCTEAVEHDINIFLVLRKKVYKNFAKKYQKEFNKMVGYDICHVFGKDIEDNKKLLKSQQTLQLEDVKERLKLAEDVIRKAVKKEHENRKSK